MQGEYSCKEERPGWRLFLSSELGKCARTRVFVLKNQRISAIKTLPKKQTKLKIFI